ncbi:MAG: rubrerythrin [Deltaproteobacteria bacterium RIFOXYA12_FULL_61_11]|nr:MAG: rubrerythrin [Deltaproteobacteria bacterium RIFOXYA12_FULL_61_11]
MTTLAGTKTLTNLMAAFAGESQARNRYTYYSKIARNEGYILVAKIFEETADQEKEHAKALFKYLKDSGAEVTITGTFPTVMAGSVENLAAAAEGEHHEWAEMYPAFAVTAEQEGFKDIAVVLRNIAKAEAHHQERYDLLRRRLQSETMFRSDGGPVKWVCQNCGMVHEGPQAPEKCPACAHPKAHFRRADLNF